MKISRTLQSCAGTFGLVTLTQVAWGQAAPDVAPPPAAAPGAAPAAAPVAPAAADAPAAAPTPPPGEAAAPAAPPPPPSEAVAPPPPGDQPPPAVLPPAPPPVDVAPVAPPAAAEPVEPLPKKLAAAKTGWLQIGGLAQAWYVYEKGDGLATDADTGDTVTSVNYFRLRRAQLKFYGSILPDTVDYFILTDFAKTLKGKSSSVMGADGEATRLGYYGSGQDTAPLLDFNITFKSDYVDVTVGQWKSPISYEAGTSSSDLLFAERSNPSRYFGDNYDIGLKLEKKIAFIKYSAQVLQGNKANTTDTNKQKDLALRLEFYPEQLEGVFVGAAGLASVGQRGNQSSTRDIVEIDAGYDRDGLLVRGEVLWGWYGPTDADERTKARGMSLSAAYLVAKQIQPAVRVGVIDVDQTIVVGGELPLESKFGLLSDQARTYEFGVNWFVKGGKNAKVMASYGYTDLDSVQGIDEADGASRHRVTLAAQAAF